MCYLADLAITRNRHIQKTCLLRFAVYRLFEAWVPAGERDAW